MDIRQPLVRNFHIVAAAEFQRVDFGAIGEPHLVFAPRPGVMRRQQFLFVVALERYIRRARDPLDDIERIVIADFYGT